MGVVKVLARISVLIALAAVSAIVQAQTVTYIHTDALGTPIAMSDAAGNVIETSEYSPYGDLLNRSDSDGPGYTGHVQDAATGLTYMQQRYYDPQIGMFLSVDPVTAYQGLGSQFHRYRYGNNNPYRFTDPDGRVPVETIWDAANVAMGAQSAYSNFSQGNVGAGIVDSVGVVVDVAATAVPYVPGGAGTAIKAVRGVDKAVDVAKTAERTAEAGKAADKATGTIYVDSKGNAIPTPPGGRIEGSPDGRYVQAKDANGIETGVRIDGGHRPSTHPDPRAQEPHGHVPGVANDDGTPWLPLKKGGD